MTVNEYIAKQPSPQKEILEELRKIILESNPGIGEEMKMGVPWYAGKFYIVALRDHVNMGFSYNKMLEKYQKELEGKGAYMRHRKFRSQDDIDEKLLIELMEAVQEGYVEPHPKA
jgi:hypothetical protein